MTQDTAIKQPTATTTILGRPIDTNLFEQCISASLAVAAAICFVDSTKFPGVFFGFCCLGFIFRDPVLEVLTRPMSRHISESATKTVEDLFRDENRFDRLLSAGTNALQRTLGSAPIRNTLKAAILESMQDEEIGNLLLQTTTRAIVKASEDDGLLRAFTGVAKQSMLETLGDREFMRESTSLIVGSILAAVKDEELKIALLAGATEAVSAALLDEKFVAIFRSVMKDVLSDGEMYRAGAAGLVGALMPSRGSKKKLEDSTMSKNSISSLGNT